MKKVFLAMIMCMFACTGFAQWTKTDFEADELKGNDAYTSYVYECPGVGSFIFWSNKEGQYRIVNESGIFNYTSGWNKYSGHYQGLSVTVGLYDDNDKLIDKFDEWLDSQSDRPTFLETRDMGAMFNPVGQKKKVKKIMAHLHSGSGYVRIIADTYGNGADFDLRIPHLD